MAESKTNSLQKNIILSICFTIFLLLTTYIFIYAIEVFLVTFAGILFAIFLRTISNFLHRRFNFPDKFSVAIALVLFTGFITLSVVISLPIITEQFSQLMQQLPTAWTKLQDLLKSYLNLNSIPLVQNFTAEQLFSINKDILSSVTNIFSNTFGAIGTFLFFILLGVYFSFNPNVYVDGTIKLLPPTKRAKAKDWLHKMTMTLRWWLIGKIITMAIVGVLTSIGLWLLNVPLAFILGFLAAMLTFIPNIGPLIAAIPAILIGFAQGSTIGIYVIILYSIIFSLEGYWMTPVIQEKTVSLPSAFTLTAQLLMGLLTGVLGLALAIPLLVVVVGLVQSLYIEDYLEDEIEQKPQSNF